MFCYRRISTETNSICYRTSVPTTVKLLKQHFSGQKHRVNDLKSELFSAHLILQAMTPIIFCRKISTHCGKDSFLCRVSGNFVTAGTQPSIRKREFRDRTYSDKVNAQ
ncbi:hypothetical protein TNIN_149701 [Trichonephila inaurata madagascariensis]|uniref:Uncharacterized protein n=1 Tax=Trichonephila inaurata madagascariensis TaxID=2747483 RepID=A0A8X6YNX6_9ARAC|nr:hypothetical protein TNIN_149701 [Trichonephila inaurata madagascariensis]